MSNAAPRVTIHETPTGILVRIGDPRMLQAHGEAVLAWLHDRKAGTQVEVVVNLSKVATFQSAGLATLARVAFEHRLKLVYTDDKVHRLLDLMGILPVVDIGREEKAFVKQPPPEGDDPTGATSAREKRTSKGSSG